MRRIVYAVAATVISIFSTQAMAQSLGDFFGSLKNVVTGGQQTQPAKVAPKETALRVCERPLGSIIVYEPSENWWDQSGLDSPGTLVTMYIARSNCFTFAEPPSGNAEADTDFTITPNLYPPDVGSSMGGAFVGAMLGELAGDQDKGQAAGNLIARNSVAHVSLAVGDNLRQKWHKSEGLVTNNDPRIVSLNPFIGGNFISADAVRYETTANGRMFALSYLEAFNTVVGYILGLPEAPARQTVQLPAAPVAEAPQARSASLEMKPVATAKKGTLYSGPSVKSDKIRDLPTGTVLYLTDKRSGRWRQVVDNMGKEGWAPEGILNTGQ